MDKLHVLFIIQRLTGGGAERVCLSIANGLSLKGHDVSILTRRLSKEDYPVESSIEVYETSGRNFIERRFDYYSKVIRIVRSKNIDIVINVLNNYPAETAMICHLLGVKCVFSDHNSYERPKEAPFNAREYLLKHFVIKLYNYTTVLTERDKYVLNNRDDVEVMPNPLFLEPLPRIPSKNKNIVAVGRLNVWYTKGFDVLIKAWGKICKKYPDWNLRIVGEGTNVEHERIKGFIINSHAERVSIVPFRKDIEEEYKNAEVFVLSSRFEGFGLVLIEAMSQRCACIACDYLTRQRDIVTDGVDGLICPVNDVESLAEKIDRVLSDEELRRYLQNNSTVNLSRYRESNITLMWERFLNRIVS